MLTKQKYRLLFSPKRRSRPGPKGPIGELIDAVVEMKRRNPTWGCKRIAQQITLAFGVDIDKWSAGFWKRTSDRGSSPAVRRGFPLLATLKTRYGRSICFDVNRQSYERTGFWW